MPGLSLGYITFLWNGRVELRLLLYLKCYCSVSFAFSNSLLSLCRLKHIIELQWTHDRTPLCLRYQHLLLNYNESLLNRLLSSSNTKFPQNIHHLVTRMIAQKHRFDHDSLLFPRIKSFNCFPMSSGWTWSLQRDIGGHHSLLPVLCMSLLSPPLHLFYCHFQWNWTACALFKGNTPFCLWAFARAFCLTFA